MDTTKIDAGAGYVPPTSAELRDILGRMGLSGREAGELVACSGRQILRYTSEGAEKAVMPFTILYTLAGRHSGCVLTPENWRNELVIQPKDAGSLVGVKL